VPRARTRGSATHVADPGLLRFRGGFGAGQLPSEQQQRIRGAFHRFDSLPPDERARLRDQFEQMTPAQRESFLDGARAQNRAAMIREFNDSMPPEERRATREMLHSLTPEQRRAFHLAWRSLPPEQREAYRRRLLNMTPQQRGARQHRRPAA